MRGAIRAGRKLAIGRRLARKCRCAYCPTSKVNSSRGNLASNWSSHNSAHSPSLGVRTNATGQVLGADHPRYCLNEYLSASSLQNRAAGQSVEAASTS